MGRQAALILLLCGCDPAPPFGEVLVEVDAEPSVPRFLSRLRVDLYAPDGTWYQSREFGAPNPADWPLSFGLYTDERAGKSVRVRLRGYPAGAVRDFRGERFQPSQPFVDPPSAHSLAELCANPPPLLPNQRLTQRHGAAALTELVAQNDCAPPTLTGAVAARIVIPETALYHFEVVSAVPDGSVGETQGDTTLFLRAACDDPASQIACGDDIDPSIGNYLSRFEVQLDPGEYFLLTGGKSAGAPADLTLAWARSDQWNPSPASPEPEPSPDPRDVLQGDETPPREPQPNLAIDLLTDVPVRYGQRRTARVLLRGECLGTQADLRGGLTCMGTAGERVPVAAAPLSDGLQRAVTNQVGTWAAERAVPCAASGRDPGVGDNGQPLFDEEVCIPGGAFLLGDPEIVGVATRNGSPGQAAVVAPFLLDRYELTVARYRQALRDGFVPPDSGPTVNEELLSEDVTSPFNPQFCTWSLTRDDRERKPLNCVTWYTAGALCRFLGGELPSHVEWEYAATAGADPETSFPWGNQPPDCCQAVWGSGYFDGTCINDALCGGSGTASVDDKPYTLRDVSGFGVSGMAGNLTEMVADAFAPYTSPCWWQQPLRGVGCQQEQAPRRSVRGGSWQIDATFTRPAFVFGHAPGNRSSSLGFRCARHP